MKYTELKQQRQQKYEDMTTLCGVFFAFSDKQLKEGMKKYPLSKGDKYVSMGAGGFIKKNQVEAYFELMKSIDSWFKKEHKNIKKEEAILYELNNYECFHSGDTSTAYDVLKEQGITKEEVQEVYRANYQLRNGYKARGGEKI